LDGDRSSREIIAEKKIPVQKHNDCVEGFDEVEVDDVENECEEYEKFDEFFD
jgi:hypothetical protein